jgi:hypothetical protein
MTWIKSGCFGVAVLWVVLVPVSSEPDRKFLLLETGSFHGNEVGLRQPHEWLGLFCKEQICSAKPAFVKTARDHDEIVDEDAKANTGTSVTLATPERPLFLVRGLSLAPHPIPTAFVGERNLEAGDQFSAEFQGSRYLLRAEGVQVKDESLPKGSRLVFSHGLVSQELFSLPEGGNDPYITILWIGDIDGDGKPDLYLNTSWHYNVSHKVLWLSSLAHQGQLVGVAAFFETTGC